MAEPTAAMMPPPLSRVAALTLLSCSGLLMAEEAVDSGERLLAEACTQCHPLAPITTTRDGRAGWEDTVHKMVVAGAQLDIDETEQLIDYLVSRYGPSSGPMRTGRLPPDAVIESGSESVGSADLTLVPGEGADLVRGLCQSCHDLGRIVSTRRSARSWRRYTASMLEQGGIPATPEQIADIVDYLTRHYGE